MATLATTLMELTPLHQKPVHYGSEWAKVGFLALTWLHALAGAMATVTGIIAVVSTKGMRRHVRTGKLFVWMMVAAACTGIVLDVVRLSVYVTENHTKYPELAMPSTYPARIAFMYAALCILYMLRQGVHRRVFARKRTTPTSAADRWLPAALLLLGALLSALIYARFNPWTGALWMIWTFMAGLAVGVGIRARAAVEAAFNVVEHRFYMLFLAGFSWWAALQGFGPAIALLVSGPDGSAGPYVGDRAGDFDPGFFFYLIGWLPPFVLAGWLFRRFARRRRAE